MCSSHVHEIELIAHKTSDTIPLTDTMTIQLEAMRAARVQQEEALSLMQVQSTVQNIQHLEKMKQKQELLVRSQLIQSLFAYCEHTKSAELAH